MALRIEERIGALLAGLLLVVPSLLAQQELRYEVWHGHSRPPHIRKAGRLGTLTIDERGISFEETYENGRAPKHPHSWRWEFQDIQQLKVSPASLAVLTYKDNKWKFGADRQYEFELPSGKTFEDAYRILKNRLDQRLVSAVADSPAAVLWEVPVKHLLRFGGDEGVLQVGADSIVYRSAKKGETRTWRYQDIDSISSAGPFQLTITTFERARLDYGSLKAFNFQLKRRLEESRYDELWLRLNQSKGLRVLTLYRAGEGR